LGHRVYYAIKYQGLGEVVYIPTGADEAAGRVKRWPTSII